MNEHDRWCPTCGIWVPDDQQRVRGDGLRRHSACDTITTLTKTTKGEHVALHMPGGGGKLARKCTCEIGEDHFAETLFATPAEVPEPVRELAARMAQDEAAEGNYTGAAALEELAHPARYVAPAELRWIQEEEHVGYHRHTGEPDDPTAELKRRVGTAIEHIPAGGEGTIVLGDPDAPTGPLTPGQVRCRVCWLDDRTRAASSPIDQLCDVCRADTPNRMARARRAELKDAAERYLGVEDALYGELPSDSAELDLRQERVEALMQLADLLTGAAVPERLVKRAELGFRTFPDLIGEVDDEMTRQDERWGEQNHPILPLFEDVPAHRDSYARQAQKWKDTNDARAKIGELSWDGIVQEELFEALAESDPAKIRAELIQTAAVVLQMIGSLDRAAAAREAVAQIAAKEAEDRG